MSGIQGDCKDDASERQDSLQRILSSDYTNENTQLDVAGKMIERPVITPKNKDYAIFLQEYSILSEYNMVCNQDLKGIYVIPSAQNSYVWFGVQFIRQGPYKGGVFRFTINLPQDFTEGGCPKIVFQTKVFHPLINPETGELGTSWGFPEWKKNNRVWQLVQYITKILIKVDTKMTSVNQEAHNLLQNNLELFEERVKICVKESLGQIFNPPATDDPHFITFTQYNKEVHDPVRRDIFESKTLEDHKPRGFSWVQPGSLQPFSKLDTR